MQPQRQLAKPLQSWVKNQSEMMRTYVWCGLNCRRWRWCWLYNIHTTRGAQLAKVSSVHHPCAVVGLEERIVLHGWVGPTLGITNVVVKDPSQQKSVPATPAWALWKIGVSTIKSSVRMREHNDAYRDTSINISSRPTQAYFMANKVDRDWSKEMNTRRVMIPPLFRLPTVSI